MDRAEGVREHYRAEGAVAERERIIALLGQNIMQGEGTQWMQFAIALIKGEQS